MQLRGRYSSSTPMIGLTPLIDVVFILLVFFMLASSFLDWRGFEMSVAVREGSAARAADIAPVTLEVSGNGAVSMNGAAVPIDTLADRILHKHKGAHIFLQPVNDATLQQLIHLLDALGKGGVRNVDLIDQ